MDFRSRLYEKYVSEFKLGQYQQRDAHLLPHFAWCENKYLPLLESLNPDARILELGCGSGCFLRFLNEHGFTNAKGIDISKEQVEMALEFGMDAEVSDVIDYLSGKEEKFDAVIAIDLFEHLYKEELMALSRLIFKSLRKGGLLVAQTPNGQGLFPGRTIYGDLTHVTILTPRSSEQLLQQAGFQNFRFFETGPTTKNAKGIVRTLLWTLVKLTANAIRRIESGSGRKQAVWTENMIFVCRKAT